MLLFLKKCIYISRELANQNRVRRQKAEGKPAATEEEEKVANL
jgi:hypothetical protein